MWGLDYEKLMQTSEDLRIKFHSLENFCDTRFANSKSKVFDKVIKMLPAILSVLESDVLRAEENRSGCEAAISAVREKGDKSREIRGRLYNKLNLLLLMGLNDIYILYSRLIKICQDYKMFPHQRYDQLLKTLQAWKEMISHFSDPQCSGKDCDLKFYHSSLASMKNEETIGGVPVPFDYPESAAGLSSETRHSRGQRNTQAGLDVPEFHDTLEAFQDFSSPALVSNVNGKLEEFSRSLCEDIESRAVDEEDKEVIEHTRSILEFDVMMTNMRRLGLTEDIFAITTFPKFFSAVKSLEIPGIDIVGPEIVEYQYKQFVRILSELTQGMEKIDPVKLLSQMMSEEKLYDKIQVILHIISYSALKSSCESVLESVISEYEYAWESRKRYLEQSVTDNFEIIKNGPSIANCDAICKKALDSYFKNKSNWHFVTNKIHLNPKSLTVRRLEDEPSPLPFMDN